MLSVGGEWGNLIVFLLIMSMLLIFYHLLSTSIWTEKRVRLCPGLRCPRSLVLSFSLPISEI